MFFPLSSGCPGSPGHFLAIASPRLPGLPRITGLDHCIVNMPKPIEDDMEYQSRHTKKRKHEALTEETVEDKPSPEAKTSGSGTADPDEMFPEQSKTLNEWKKFMKPRGKNGFFYL